MKLDETQMARVREWIDQGLKVADIQNRLVNEFDIRLTYMEARFLLDDLQLRPKDPPPAPKPPAAPAGGPSGVGGLGGAGAVSGKGPALPPGATALTGPTGIPLTTTPMPGQSAGKVSVSVDNLARPGALVSGKVTFSDGQQADWQMDQYGRLGVAPRTMGYKPTQADVASFQAELEAAMARLGY